MSIKATGLVVAAGAFAAMEPVTCAAHRFVMHGAGWVLHRSHHQPPSALPRPVGLARLEANDAYPVVFAGATVAMMAAGTRVRSLRFLVAVGAGVTAYGAAYAFVHDVVIHQRLVPGLRVGPRLAALRDAHGVHHRSGGAPFGMLWPVVPAHARASR